MHEERNENCNLDVILIREKLSKLSNKMTLNNSILLKVLFAKSEAELVLKPLLWIERSIELAMMLDPAALSEQAVLLNLKLMKWR